MRIGKLFKWSASAVRIVSAKLRLRSRLRLPYGGKPVYLGRGVRLFVAEGGVMELGRGAYIDDRCRLQVSSGAFMSLGEGCYLNTNCRVVAAEGIDIGAHTMLGPNACVFDHDHVFDAEGVRDELVSSPIIIGDHCWLGANAVVTSGCSISAKSLISANAVVTRDLLDEGALYAGVPARLIKRFE